MQKNDYLLAKIGVDTAENEPFKSVVSRPLQAQVFGRRAALTLCFFVEVQDAVARELAKRGEIAPGPLEDHRIRGSFSAVSTPIFASK